MTHSIIGRCVLVALLTVALAGCGSNNPSPVPDAAGAIDTHLAPAPDVASDHSIAADASPIDTTLAPDVAPSDAPVIQDTVAFADGSADVTAQPDAGKPDVAVADVPAFDVAALDVAAVPDAGSAPDVATAFSSVQRVVDPQVSAADSTTLASDDAAFAFAAYKQIIIAGNTNLVFSPASISIALAMTYAGAAGTTATEMAQALHFSLPPGQLHPAFNALDQTLASRGQGKLGADGGPMRLHIVNALWAEQSYTFKTTFLDTLAANYGAGMNLLDFISAPDPSRLTINAWVAAQTEDKILDLLPAGSVDSSTKLVLTNAVYFNAAWNVPFDPNDTRDGSFTLIDSSNVTAQFMNAELFGIPAVQGTNFVAASLPYADNNLSLLVVIPAAGKFTQVESSLDASTLASLVAGLTSQQVRLTLPRFKVETGTSLAKLLQTLGMTSAFIPGTADFSGMDGTHSLFISDVIHKAFIDVAEKGTEAAAATGVVVTGAAAPSGLLVSADHPFLYFLRDQPTGAILFMGRVLDPSKN